LKFVSDYRKVFSSDIYAAGGIFQVSFSNSFNGSASGANFEVPGNEVTGARFTPPHAPTGAVPLYDVYAIAINGRLHGCVLRSRRASRPRKATAPSRILRIKEKQHKKAKGAFVAHSRQ
jgi:hypothetical protein